MSANLYQLRLDSSVVERWYLKPPLDPSGEAFEPPGLLLGEPLHMTGEIFYPLAEPGPALDITIIGWDFLVNEDIASLIGQLAPNDVQRLPARVESTDGHYELLNVLARIDCVDREQTPAIAYVGDPPELRKGTLASLAPFIGPEERLIGHVMNDEMRLRSDGIDGARVFRVTSWDLWPVVTEEIKAALEEYGATGVDYRLVS